MVLGLLWWVFLPNARPANRSQVLKVKLCSLWLVHYQQQLKMNNQPTKPLEVEFCPKLHLCNLRDPECSFGLLLCCPTLLNRTNWERNLALRLALAGSLVAMERIRAESIRFMFLMSTDQKNKQNKKKTPKNNKTNQQQFIL